MKSTVVILAALLVLAFAGANATATRDKIEVVYQGSPANYQLYIFGGQALCCRGNDLHVARDERGDGDGPIVVECR